MMQLFQEASGQLRAFASSQVGIRYFSTNKRHHGIPLRQFNSELGVGNIPPMTLNVSYYEDDMWNRMFGRMLTRVSTLQI